MTVTCVGYLNFPSGSFSFLPPTSRTHHYVKLCCPTDFLHWESEMVKSRISSFFCGIVSSHFIQIFGTYTVPRMQIMLKKSHIFRKGCFSHSSWLFSHTGSPFCCFSVALTHLVFFRLLCFFSWFFFRFSFLPQICRPYHYVTMSCHSDFLAWAVKSVGFLLRRCSCDVRLTSAAVLETLICLWGF